MKALTHFFIFSSFVFSSGVVLAQSGGANSQKQKTIPNCYQFADFKKNEMQVVQSLSAEEKAKRFTPVREFFWILDETTPFSDDLRGKMLAIAKKQMRPGDAFYVASFSFNGVVNGKEYYLKNLFEYKLDNPIDEKKDKKLREKIGQDTLKKFDNCLEKQKGFVLKSLDKAAEQVKNAYSKDISKSDILYTLREISVRIKSSKAKERIVFLASDMLENSSITSFYSNNQVRKIDPKAELAKPDVQKMKGDFGGAKIFVFGAGVVSQDDAKSNAALRNPQTIDALKEFWDAYFKASNASLAEFGHPLLLGSDIYPPQL